MVAVGWIVVIFASGVTLSQAITLDKASALLQQNVARNVSDFVSRDPLLLEETWTTVRQRVGRAEAEVDLVAGSGMVDDLQHFIQRSGESFASLVIFGDSTVSGVTHNLLQIGGKLQDILYISNDRARAVRDVGRFIKPGEDWSNESAMSDKAAAQLIQRARASTEALHAKGCKSGGGLETYMFSGGPLKGLVVHHWGFLPEYTDFCWDTCMSDAMAALKPTAVMWNIGFHLLNHDFNADVCAVRQNPAEKKNCANYKEMIKLGSRAMLDAGVKHVMFRHTNFVCEKRQNEGFPVTAQALAKWHDTSQRDALERSCAKECPLYAKKGLTCYDWFFDAHTTERFHEEATAAIEELRQELAGGEGKSIGGTVHNVDAFTITKECCARGCEKETKDGEHYTWLDNDVISKMALILSGQAEDA